MVFKANTSITARQLRAVCILGMLSLPALYANAGTAPQPTPTAIAPVPATKIAAGNSGPAAKTVKPDISPTWAELTPALQQALAPLAQEWNQLDGNHKAKWLAIGNKYQTMNPEQQRRLQDNIRDWAKLTPEQHRIARESYARAKKLNREQKASQWQQYQQLPEEQKQKLAADAAAKKRIANLPNPQNKTKTVESLKPPKNHSVASGLAPQTGNRAAVTTAKPPLPSTAPPPANNPAGLSTHDLSTH